MQQLLSPFYTATTLFKFWLLQSLSGHCAEAWVPVLPGGLFCVQNVAYSKTQVVSLTSEPLEKLMSSPYSYQLKWLGQLEENCFFKCFFVLGKLSWNGRDAARSTEGISAWNSA